MRLLYTILFILMLLPNAWADIIEPGQTIIRHHLRIANADQFPQYRLLIYHNPSNGTPQEETFPVTGDEQVFVGAKYIGPQLFIMDAAAQDTLRTIDLMQYFGQASNMALEEGNVSVLYEFVLKKTKKGPDIQLNKVSLLENGQQLWPQKKASSGEQKIVTSSSANWWLLLIPVLGGLGLWWARRKSPVTTPERTI